MHSPTLKSVSIAILDDYQGVALKMADWSAIQSRASISVFSSGWNGVSSMVKDLCCFDVLCVMRERTQLPVHVLRQLPQLKLIASTGPKNAAIDMAAASSLGIDVLGTTSSPHAPIELTWALILSASRHIVPESEAVRRGAWQSRLGGELHGKTLGILGLGRIGAQIATIARAFGMSVIAWSEHLDDERATAVGAIRVAKDRIFRDADIVTIHLALNDRTLHLVGRAELELMKTSALLINTARGEIVVESDLIDALRNGLIAGAAVDVYDLEPLPLNHPYRTAPHLLATPHIGYVTRELYERFYGETVANLSKWLDARAQH